MSLITEEIRSKATELYHGNDICKAQFQRLLNEVGLPNGLLPLEDVLECGHIEETGFVWMKQRKETKHKFGKIGRVVSYGTEVTAYVEQCKIKKLTGVKAKELLIWLTLTEITVDSPESKNIVFKTTTGLFRTFPTDAFVIKEAAGKEEVVKVLIEEADGKEEVVKGLIEEAAGKEEVVKGLIEEAAGKDEVVKGLIEEAVEKEEVVKGEGGVREVEVNEN